MINNMTPNKRVEEIVAEFDAFLEKYTGKHENTFELAKTLFADTVRVRKDIIVNDFRTALTRYHQDMMSEVVEKIETEIDRIKDGDIKLVGLRRALVIIKSLNK